MPLLPPHDDHYADAAKSSRCAQTRAGQSGPAGAGPAVRWHRESQIFATLKDETGIANIIVWAKVVTSIILQL
jgi:hypothetical protein